MAKIKKDKKLYDKMRDNGIRKSVARDLAELPAHVSDGKQAPKPLRDAVDRLEERRQGAEDPHRPRRPQDRRAEAARTRSQNAESRSAAARKAARTRAKSSGSSAGRHARRFDDQVALDRVGHEVALDDGRHQDTRGSRSGEASHGGEAAGPAYDDGQDKLRGRAWAARRG